MKAIYVEEKGGPEVLKLKELPDLAAPGPGQARIRLKAAGVNFMDVGQRRGTYPREVPFIPGAEGAGLVEAVGAGVTVVKPGDKVAYTGVPGSYAQAILAEAEKLIPLPAGFSFAQGAAFPLQGMTAHYLIHEYRPIKAGDWVLIHAAAGGVGGLLVSWARHLGATVVGTTSSPEKAKAVLAAGAQHVINYATQDFAAEVKALTGGRGVDLIIDGVGQSTAKGNLEAVAIRGSIVVFGAASGTAEPISPNALMPKSIQIGGGGLANFMRTRQELMSRAEDVLKGLREGWLKQSVETHPLAQAAEAHRRLEGRQTLGKLVLLIED